jgi:hypothetical protein
MASRAQRKATSRIHHVACFGSDLSEMFYSSSRANAWREITVNFLLDKNIISEIRKRDRANARVARWVARTPE